jgi:predicted metal-binding membrane protein
VESAALTRAPALSRLIRLGLIGTLLVLAAVGWLVTGERMAGMDMGPGTDPGTLGFWVTAWVVMMAAMMFPSIAPMVMMYARLEEGKKAKGQSPPFGATAVFVAGYLLAWSTAGLAGYSILSLGHELSPGFLAWDEAGPYVAGGVILGAAIYQLTPLKDVCLTKCRSPFEFLLTAWRPGRVGAFRMGITHGGWCVGCCWALMAALFALGVMSVGWMIFVAALIATEKLLPWKAVANRGIAVLLLVVGLSVAFWPERVPGLTLPDTATADEAMMRMGAGSMTDEAMQSGSMERSAKGGSMKDRAREDNSR